MQELYKNILIFGRTRVGKSTLAYKISDKFPYQILRADPIRDSLNNCFKELNIGIDTAVKNERYQFFLYDYLCRMVYEARERYGYVLEGFEISHEAIKKYFINDSTLIYALGTLDIDASDFAKNIKDNDTKYDWTYGMNDKELLEFAKGELKASKILQQFCIDNNIPFYNTANNRDIVLNQILDDISKKYVYTLNNS